MDGLEHSPIARFRRALPGVARDQPVTDFPDCDGRLVDARVSSERAVSLCESVIDLVSAMFSVSGRQLRSPKRHGRTVARVRQIGMYVAHVTLGMRMSDVATGFGRDKSTVVHACHVIEDLREDAEFDLIVAKVEQITRVAFRVHGQPERVDA